MTLGQTMLYNIMYEVEGACTSIVAESAAGDIFHARNLDFGLFFGKYFINFNPVHESSYVWCNTNVNIQM